MTDRVPLVQETSCNLCGERDYEVIGERDRDGRPLRTTICQRCGLVWTNPRPTLDALADYYGHHYRQDYKHMPAPTPRKLLRGVIGAIDRRRLLSAVLKTGDRILDVGSGAGELVFVLRHDGYEAEGLEPDEAYAGYGRETLGVPVTTGTVGEIDLPRASFDVVTMFHALEHVGDPVNVLRSVARWLKPRGVLVIEVPNVEAVCHAPHHRFHYAHLFSFSQGTLAASAARAGFSQVSSVLSADGGNIIAVFRNEPAVVPPEPRRAQFERTRAVLRGHTFATHYLSPSPYVRVLDRLARRWLENRLLRQFSTVEGILGAVKSGVLNQNRDRA